MKYTFLLLAISFVMLSSCTSAYKTGQTPDDVYFSQAIPQNDYEETSKRNNKYRFDDEYYDDRYLRMKVSNRTRWNDLNDWYYYDRYGYRYNYYYGSWNNPYNSWNYYYNPYCPNTVVISNPKQITAVNDNVKPRNFNLSGYTNTSYNNANNNLKVNIKNGVVSRPVVNNNYYNPRNSNYNNNNGSWLNNAVKDIFRGGSTNSGSGNSRSYNPTNSSGSSSSGSNSSSSGDVSRPKRGGN